MKNCADYDESVTEYHVSTLTGDPVRCTIIHEKVGAYHPGNIWCASCKRSWQSPIGFGYTRIQQHYMASRDFAEKNNLSKLFDKLKLNYTESQNHYQVNYNSNTYFINKRDGAWLRLFNIIDFVRYFRPEDWETFLHINFPEINFDKFALERTNKNISEIFPAVEKAIPFTRYISERSDEVKRILTDEQNYNVIAFTGSGKTEAFVKTIQALKLKAVFLTPYESTVKQLKGKYKIPVVYGGVNTNEVRAELSYSNLIASTYDGLRKILDCQIMTEEYILLIDEVHNLVTQADFRGNAINLIIQNISNFRKVINITGTPEGVLNNDYLSIRFIKANQRSIIQSYDIIVSHEKTASTCVDHIIKQKPRGKVIIFRNSIQALETIKQALFDNGVDKNKIRILHSNEKEGKLFQRIVEDEVIPTNIKYVLTTSVISGGVNIMNQNIDSVYLLECDNLIMLRQFIARFRMGIKHVYDLIPIVKEELRSKSWFDFHPELKRLIKMFQGIADEKTRFLDKSGLVKNYARANFLRSIGGQFNTELQYLNINKDTEQVEVNEQLLIRYLLENLHNVAYWNYDKRKEYIDYFLSVNSNIIDDYKVVTDTEAARDMVKQKAAEKRDKIITLLEAKPSETVSAFLKYIDINLLRKVEKRLNGLYNLTSGLDEFYLKNRKLLQLKDASKIIHKYILFYKYRFPHEFIIYLLKKSDNEIYEFELNYYTQLNLFLVRNFEPVLKYNRRAFDVFYYAVFKYLYDFFQNIKSFTYDDLLRDLNAYLIEKKITHRKMSKGKLGEIINRLINKSRDNQREGKRVASVGWKVAGFKEVEDIVGNDPVKAKIINDSFTGLMSSNVEFIQYNLFLQNFDKTGANNTELRRMIAEMKEDLEELTK